MHLLPLQPPQWQQKTAYPTDAKLPLALWIASYARPVRWPEQCAFGATPLSGGEGQPR